MYLIGFIIRIYHNALSSERQMRFSHYSNKAQQGWLTVKLPVQSLNLSLKLVKTNITVFWDVTPCIFGP